MTAGRAPPRFRTIKGCPKDTSRPICGTLSVRLDRPLVCRCWWSLLGGSKAHVRGKRVARRSEPDRRKQFGPAVGAAAQGAFLGSAMRGIAEWLASIGLGEYAQRFAENAIDLSVVRDLTEQDLKDRGVLLGHRRKILRAIAELDGVAPAPVRVGWSWRSFCVARGERLDYGTNV